MEQCTEEMTSPGSYIALPWGEESSPLEEEWTHHTSSWDGLQLCLTAGTARMCKGCYIALFLFSSSNCALLLYLPLMHNEMQPEDIHSLPRIMAEVAEATWDYSCHMGEQSKLGLPWGLGLPALRQPPHSAISTAFHSIAWALAVLPCPVWGGLFNFVNDSEWR